MDGIALSLFLIAAFVGGFASGVAAFRKLILVLLLIAGLGLVVPRLITAL